MSALAETRPTVRPSLRDQLIALVSHIAKRYVGATIYVVGNQAELVLVSGVARVSLWIGSSRLGDVEQLGRADQAVPWLTLAACAEELHREAGRIINLCHEHMADLR